MKLKKQVKYDSESMTLELGTDHKVIDEEDCYIFQAMHDHVSDAAQFIRLVMDTEHTDEVEAGFRMAAFVEEYGRFLENEPAGIIRYHDE